MEAISDTATSIITGVPKEINTTNAGFHPTVLGESAYSGNMFVLVWIRKNFIYSCFFIHEYKLVH